MDIIQLLQNRKILMSINVFHEGLKLLQATENSNINKYLGGISKKFEQDINV